MINLTNRGYPMLHLFSGGGFVSYHQAHIYDQRPFRSMLLRGYIAYHPGKGFKITAKGREAWEEFTSTQIDQRKNQAAHLTRVFDADRWGLNGA